MLLEDTLIYRISHGRSVHVWHDRWIPGIPYNKPMVHSKTTPNIVLVSDLIDHSISRWKLPMLNTYFSPDVVSVISSIPLYLVKMEDKVIWGLSANGVYSVKSDY